MPFFTHASFKFTSLRNYTILALAVFGLVCGDSVHVHAQTDIPPRSTTSGDTGMRPAPPPVYLGTVNVDEVIKREQERSQAASPEATQATSGIEEHPLDLHVRVGNESVGTKDPECARVIYRALDKHGLVPAENVTDPNCEMLMKQALEYQRKLPTDRGN